MQNTSVTKFICYFAEVLFYEIFFVDFIYRLRYNIVIVKKSDHTEI